MLFIFVILGAVVFIFFYGVQALDPTYVDWLYVNGDKTQHYLGWVAFRNGSWTFPLGLTDQLSYPDETSIFYTDSLPLLAIFFKLLSPILPETFQYFGLWRCLAYVLNGLVSAKLLQCFFKNNLQIVFESTPKSYIKLETEFYAKRLRANLVAFVMQH